MLLALLLAASSLAFALALTPLARSVFRRSRLVDHPNSGRKKHAVPIPRVGGIVIVISLILSGCVAAASGLGALVLGDPSTQLLIRLLPAVGIIFVTGLLDDLFHLRPWQKLLGELIAASVAYSAGLHVEGLAGYAAASWLSPPLTVLWLVLCTNAFNLIDGMDGLATGAGLFATLTIVLAAVLQSNTSLALAAVPLVGALLGFLRYNFNPATVFLGDSGSLLIGFLLGCFGVVWSLKTATIFGIVAPVMAMCVPLLDVVLSVARRFLRGHPVFEADRRHLHHRLLERGLTPRRVVLLLYGACAVGATLSLLQTVFHNQYGGLAILLFCIGAWFGIRHLGYAEFRAARHVLTGGGLQRMINVQIQLKEFQVSLVACNSFEQCWDLVGDACQRFGFAAVELGFQGQKFEERFEPASSNFWTLRVPLNVHDYLHLSAPSDSLLTSAATLPFVDLLRAALPSKLVAVRSESRRTVAVGAR
jgi:UDP-GlcNAc:undecaprenyl-phosphate GlcNAc-1-phosphate transferase